MLPIVREGSACNRSAPSVLAMPPAASTAPATRGPTCLAREGLDRLADHRRFGPVRDTDSSAGCGLGPLRGDIGSPPSLLDAHFPRLTI